MELKLVSFGTLCAIGMLLSFISWNRKKHEYHLLVPFFWAFATFLSQVVAYCWHVEYLLK